MIRSQKQVTGVIEGCTLRRTQSAVAGFEDRGRKTEPGNVSSLWVLEKARN